MLAFALAAALAERDIERHGAGLGAGPSWGGPEAPDNLELGAATQVWLAVSDDRAASVSGQYFFHQQQVPTHKDARAHRFAGPASQLLRPTDRREAARLTVAAAAAAQWNTTLHRERCGIACWIAAVGQQSAPASG